MVQSRTLRSEALRLIHVAKDLLQEEKTIFASNEDCEYFRNIYRASRQSFSNPNKPYNPKTPETKYLKPESISPVLKENSTPELPLPQKTIDLKKSEEIQKSEIEPKRAPDLSQANLASSQFNSEKRDEAEEHKDCRRSLDAQNRFLTRERFVEYQKILTYAFTDWRYLPDIPNDKKAKAISERWKTKNQSAPISILLFQETGKHHQFLTNLTTALDVFFGETKQISGASIEKENQWETFLSVPELKLIIICDSSLWQMPNLLKFYREIPNQTERFLSNTPLLLLPDLSLYLKDPSLKRSLWKAICQKISSL